MSDITQCAETPLSYHVARFWRHLETETVRILVDMKRTIGTEAPDGPVVYWDCATFSDDVAKALVADRAEVARLRAESRRIYDCWMNGSARDFDELMVSLGHSDP